MKRGRFLTVLAVVLSSNQVLAQESDPSTPTGEDEREEPEAPRDSDSPDQPDDSDGPPEGEAPDGTPATGDVSDEEADPNEDTSDTETAPDAPPESPEPPSPDVASDENERPNQTPPTPGVVPKTGKDSVTFSEDKLANVDLLDLMATDVSTATKTSESLEDAPAIITAVTADEIERWGYQSVGEVLSHVVGFYLIDDHITPNAAVRGMSGGLGAESSVIKVMIDGRSVAFRTTNGNWLGTELIPLSAIKQIEIIRGPASALYGADAFLGVVNIITIAPEDARALDARVAAGYTADKPGGRFDVTSGFWNKNFDFLLTAAGESQDRSGLRMPSESPAPRVPSYNDEYGTSQDLLRRSLVVGTRLGYVEPTAGHHAIISAYASGVRRGGDFAHWAQLTAGQDSQGREVGTVISLGQFRISTDFLYQALPTFGISLQSTYFQGGVLPDDRIEVASDLFYVERRMSYQGVDATLEGRWMPNERFNVIFGVESIYDQEVLPSARQISKETDSLLGVEDERLTADLVNFGTYVSSNLQVVERWLKLTGGARFDNHNLYGSQFSGRAGATSRLSDTVVTKLLYGHAYKAPSPYLLFAEPLTPGDVIGNEDLKPQFVDTWEGQVSWRPHRVVSGATGLSYSILKDKAEFVPQGINQTAQNTSRQRSLSWESRLDVRDANIVGGYGSFELVRSYRTTDQEGYQADLVGFENTIYPDWIGRAGVFVGLSTNPQFPLELTSQAIIVGPRRAADTSILENGGSYDLPPLVIWNAGLASRDLAFVRGQKSSVALRAKNLLGSQGPDPGFSGFEYPLTAREIFLELRHQY